MGSSTDIVSHTMYFMPQEVNEVVIVFQDKTMNIGTPMFGKWPVGESAINV
jgi:hypothetical protein